MKRNYIKEYIIRALIRGGVNFDKDVYQLSGAEKELLKQAAKDYNYRPRQNNSCLSGVVHARYYTYLQRYYLQYKDLFK